MKDTVHTVCCKDGRKDRSGFLEGQSTSGKKCLKKGPVTVVILRLIILHDFYFLLVNQSNCYFFEMFRDVTAVRVPCKDLVISVASQLPRELLWALDKKSNTGRVSLYRSLCSVL